MTIERPTFHDFTPQYQVPADTWICITGIERLDAELGQLHISTDVKEELYRESLAQNAYATARIEGNPHTLRQVTQLLRETRVPGDREAPSEREYLTWRVIVDNLDDYPVPRTVDELCQQHAELFQGVLDADKHPGELKQEPNFIGNSYQIKYVPATPARTRPEMQNALDWYHASTAHPVIRAAILFHEFESIHPFLDGNGRLGRLLFMQALHHSGYTHIRYAPVDYAFNADRQGYYDALSRVEAENWDFTSWITYTACLVADTYQQITKRIQFQLNLPIALPRKAMAIARWFHAQQCRDVRIQDVQEWFPEIPRRTLQRHLATLRDAEILSSHGELKGTRYKLAVPS